eukprot:SM000112S23965  [mRNA]  locus=s112:64092:69232:- [translate_table: standard]
MADGSEDAASLRRLQSSIEALVSAISLGAAELSAAPDMAAAATGPGERRWRRHVEANGASTPAAAASAAAGPQPGDEAGRGASPGPEEPRKPPLHGPAVLTELHIRNFALIESQTVTFAPGLNVITGESGAGKSVLLQALTQVLGAPLVEDCVRPPATSALVRAVFRVSAALAARLASKTATGTAADPANAAVDAEPAATSGSDMEAAASLAVTEAGLIQAGLAAGAAPQGRSSKGSEGGVMAVRKAAKAKSLCRIGTTQVPLKALRAAGAMLVDVNGQSSQGQLRAEEMQVSMLDHFSGSQAISQATRFQLLVHQAGCLMEKKAELAGSGGATAAALQELVDEVSALGLREGDEDRLQMELRQQEQAQELAEKCWHVIGTMTDGGLGSSATGPGMSVRGQLRAILRQLIDIQEAIGRVEDQPGFSAQDVEAAVETVTEAGTLLDQATTSVEHFAGELEYSNVRIQEIQKRLRRVHGIGMTDVALYTWQLDKVKRAFGAKSGNVLLAMAVEAEKKLLNAADLEDQLAKLSQELSGLAQEMAAVGVDLSHRRRVAAEALRVAVEDVLKHLCMERSRFQVDVSWEMVRTSSSTQEATGAYGHGDEDGEDVHEDEEGEEDEEDDLESQAAGVQAGGPGLASSSCLNVDDRLLRVANAGDVGEAPGASYRYSPSGLDKVTFKLAANVGEPLLPLGQVASGGECARVLLALKAMAGPSRNNSTAISVFDEVDSGIGGRVGARVGSVLRHLSSSGHQVICVTHLPQVAAFADWHVKVSKEAAEGGRSVTRTRVLSSQHEKAEEVAHMLGLSVGAAVELFTQAAQSVRGSGGGGNAEHQPLAPAVASTSHEDGNMVMAPALPGLPPAEMKLVSRST